MDKFKLTKLRIRELRNISESVSEFLVNLYSEVIPDKWDDIEYFNSYPQCNKNTALIIMEEMHKKWDPIQSNMLWLNKGFSSSHDTLSDYDIRIPDNCYVLKKTYAGIPDITASFVQQEVEEIGEDPEEFYEDAEKGCWNENQVNNSYL